MSDEGKSEVLELIKLLMKEYHAQNQKDMEAVNQGLSALVRDITTLKKTATESAEIKSIVSDLNAKGSNIRYDLDTLNRRHSDMDYKCYPLKMHEMQVHRWSAKEWTAIIVAVLTGVASLIYALIVH